MKCSYKYIVVCSVLLIGATTLLHAQPKTGAEDNELLNKQIQQGIKSHVSPLDKMKQREQEVALQKMAIQNQMDEIEHLKRSKSKSDAAIAQAKVLLEKSNDTLRRSIELLEKERLQARKDADSIKFLQQIQVLEKAKLNAVARGSYLLAFLLVIILVFAFFIYRSLKRSNRINKKLEATLIELKATQQQLIVKEKLASLGQLTSGIAHEIQNPLNFVNNFSSVSTELLEELKEELLKIKLSEPENATTAELLKLLSDNMKLITQHGKRAEGIVRNMLQHSSEKESVLEACALDEVVREYVQLAWNNGKSKYPEHPFALRYSMKPDMPQAVVYKHDLGRVLLAMTDNALYAMNKKAASGIAGYQAEFHVQVDFSHNQFKITLADNGIGIPDALQEKLFSPFFSTKATGEGTGLSLSIAHEIIVQQHQGKISVNSKEHEYTIFTILLPCKTSANAV